MKSSVKDYYFLFDKETKKITPTDDLDAFAKTFAEPGKRIVKQEHLSLGNHRFFISTVFLGINHNHWRIGPPLLFETMIFDESKNELDEEYCERCSTYEQALEQHEKAIQHVKKGWAQNCLN